MLRRAESDVFAGGMVLVQGPNSETDAFWRLEPARAHGVRTRFYRFDSEAQGVESIQAFPEDMPRCSPDAIDEDRVEDEEELIENGLEEEDLEDDDLDELDDEDETVDWGDDEDEDDQLDEDDDLDDDEPEWDEDDFDDEEVTENDLLVENHLMED
jgi:hypothetical protein